MGIISSLSVLLLIFLIFNILIFFFAVYEFFFGKQKNNDWVSNPHELIPDNPIVKPTVVLVHGFMGSPFDFEELAKDLQSTGFRVIVPLVPGQGSSDFAYFRGKYSVNYYVCWLKAILVNEHELTGVKPLLVGFSMGGTLAVIMASQQLVARLVLISPFFGLPFRGIALFISVFGFLIPVVPKSERGKINDPKLYMRYMPGSMLISISTFRVLMRLVCLAETAVCKIQVPVRVFCSQNDQVASYDRIKTVLRTSENIEIKEYNKGNHILLHDYQKYEIVKDIRSFLLF